MVPTDTRPSPGLLEAIRSELGPVRPLAAPARRLLRLIPLGLALLAAPAVLWALRVDAEVLGPFRLWGLSLAQTALGLGVIFLALRRSIPGVGRGAPGWGTALGMAGGWVLLVTAISRAASPLGIPAGEEAEYLRLCTGFPFLLGLPGLLLVWLMAARGLPDRPARVGALCGLGVGLLSDAGWRTFCEVSVFRHVLRTHVVSIGLLVLVGALAGWIWELLELRRLERRLQRRRQRQP